MDKLLYHVTLKTKTPVLLSNRPSNGEGSLFQSLEYLTGSSIRGSFIELWKKHFNHSHENMTSEVRDKFMDNGFVFENFYPRNTSPLPLTALTCKQFPGFKTQEDSHGVRDGLLSYYLNKNSFDMERFQCREGEDHRCQANLQTYDKLVTSVPAKTKSGATYTVADSIHKVQTGHVGIDSRTQTSQKGQLYFEDAVEINEYFKGTVQVPFSYKEEFENIMCKGSILRVGAKRTSGFGELEVYEIRESNQRISSSSNKNLKASVEERWESFQTTCKQQNVISKEEVAFSVTFISDAILLDDFYRYRSDLTTDLLTELTGISVPPAKLVHSHVEIKTIFGWNQIWRTALDDETAIKRGSSYLFITKKEYKEKWLSFLAELEKFSIGERKFAGYGQIMICHPFHLQIEEV